MKTRVLTSKGINHTVIVDNDDYDKLKNYSWYYNKTHAHAYVRVYIDGEQLLMHRVILKAKKGQMVDHINGNGLDNRRSNIRLCTNSQNQKNKKPSGRSKYLGVNIHKTKTLYYRKKTKEYVTYKTTSIIAHIKIGDKYKHLGTFKTEKDAALAYNEAAKIHHKEFARLNTF